MPFNFCLRSNKKQNPKPKKTKLSKLVKVHTDDITPVEIPSASSSISSAPSFTPSVSLNIKLPTLSQNESANQDRTYKITEEPTHSLKDYTHGESNTIPTDFNNPIEGQTKFEPSMEDLMDCTSSVEKTLQTNTCIPTDDHHRLESSMDVSINSTSSAEDKYSLLVSSAALRSSSVEKESGKVLNEMDSNESYLSPLLDDKDKDSSPNEASLTSHSKIIAKEDVEIVPVMKSLYEHAVDLMLSPINEKHLEIIGIEMKPNLTADHVKFRPFKMVSEIKIHELNSLSDLTLDQHTTMSYKPNENETQNEEYEPKHEVDKNTKNEIDLDLHNQHSEGLSEINFEANRSAGDSMINGEVELPPSLTEVSFRIEESTNECEQNPRNLDSSKQLSSTNVVFDEKESIVCGEQDQPTDCCGDSVSSITSLENNDKDCRLCEQSEIGTVEVNELVGINPEIEADTSEYEFKFSDKQRKLRNTLHSFIDAQSSPELNSMFITDKINDHTSENTNCECKNIELLFHDEDLTSMQDSVDQTPDLDLWDTSNRVDKGELSHDVLNEESLPHLEENMNRDTINCYGKLCSTNEETRFELKSKKYSDTCIQNLTPKRKVIDQVILSTQKQLNPEIEAKEESLTDLDDDSEPENINPVKLILSKQNPTSIKYNNFVSQNKLKDAIERFILKAEEFNQIKCSEASKISKEKYIKHNKMNHSKINKNNRNTCADMLINQFSKGQNSNQSCDGKMNDFLEENKHIPRSYTPSFSSTQCNKLCDCMQTGESNDSCPPFKFSVGPNHELHASLNPCKHDSSISVQSKNKQLTLNLNHTKGNKSFECIGDFVIHQNDGDLSKMPPPMTIHLTSAGKGSKKRHQSTKLTVKPTNIDHHGIVIPPETTKEHMKNVDTYNRYKEEAQKPMGPDKRTIPIQKSGKLEFNFDNPANKLKEMEIPCEKYAHEHKLGHKLHVHVSSGQRKTNSSQGNDSPRYVYSPTSFRAYRRRNKHDILLGSSSRRTSAAQKLLEDSESLRSPRCCFGVDQVPTRLSHFTRKVDSKTPNEYVTNGTNNLRLKHLELLHRRYSALKNKRDMEKIENIERSLDSSKHRHRLAKDNCSDYFGLIFDEQFKKYSRRGTVNGDLISYKRSTDWLTDAGIVESILTADEANRIFKRFAGVKVALNKHDYKLFLFKLTRMKRISYNEIYERLCGCSN